MTRWKQITSFFPLGVENGSRWGTMHVAASKGALAVVDQGLISGSNYLLGIMLARWLAPAEYGAYALAFSVFLGASLAYQAILLEPMSVFGGSIYSSRLRPYVGALLTLHSAGSVISFAVLAAVALVILVVAPSAHLLGPFVAVAVASPAVLLLWMLRRACYLRFQPGAAVVGSLLYCAAVMVQIWALHKIRALTPSVAFLVLAVASVLSCLLLLFRYRPARAFRDQVGGLRHITRRHWTYGRWALAASIAAWIPANIYYPLITIIHGIGQAAELRALLNLSLPIDQVFSAVGLILLPYLSRLQHAHSSGRTRWLGIWVGALFAIAAVAYWSLIIIFEPQLLALLYNGRYTEIRSFIPYLATYSVFAGAVIGLNINLKAMQRPAYVFVTYGISSAVAACVGPAALLLWGIQGAMYTGMLSSSAALIASLVLLFRRGNRIPAGTLGLSCGQEQIAG
jgi:O-antigen/teichoic acid export membrane protein